MKFFILARIGARIGTLAGPFESRVQAVANLTRVRYIAAQFDSRAFHYTLDVARYDPRDVPEPIATDTILDIA